MKRAKNGAIKTAKTCEDPIMYTATIHHKGIEYAWIHGTEDESRQQVRRRAERHIAEASITCLNCGAYVSECYC